MYPFPVPWYPCLSFPRFVSLRAHLFPGFFNILQIVLNQRGHLRRLPLGLLGFLMPGKRKVPDLSRLLCLFKDRERLQKDSSLTFSISYLSNRPAIRVFNGCRPRYANSPIEFMGGRENNRGEPFLFQKSCGQSDGLATEGSGRGQEHDLHCLNLHLTRNGGYGFLEEIGVLPLKAIEGVGCRSKTANDSFPFKLGHSAEG